MPWIVRPNRDALLSARLGAISHVPVFFTRRGKYLDAENSYVRDRALARFADGRLLSPAEQLLEKVSQPTPCTVDCVSWDFHNALEYLEKMAIDWRDIRHSQVVLRAYRSAMAEGTWSRSQGPLKPSTIKRRVAELQGWLQWTALRGLREESADHPPITDLQIVAGPKASGPKNSRHNTSVRRDPMDLRMPSSEEVRRWLRGVYVRWGFGKHLMCKTIIQSAIRRSEALEWRVDTLPWDRASWERVGNWVLVPLLYGTKGKKWIDSEGNFHGRERKIRIPIELAEELAEYRINERVVARDRAIRAGGLRDDPRQLFISDFTGLPFSRATLRRAWVEGPHQPFPGWSPHLARHYWACSTLFTAAVARLRATRLLHDEEAVPEWLAGNALSDIDLLVRPQLGHLRASTSQRYVGWLQSVLCLNHNYRRYVEALENHA